MPRLPLCKKQCIRLHWINNTENNRKFLRGEEIQQIHGYLLKYGQYGSELGDKTYLMKKTEPSNLASEKHSPILI